MARIPLPVDYVNKSDATFNPEIARPVNANNLNAVNQRVNELDVDIINAQIEMNQIIGTIPTELPAEGGRADTANQLSVPRNIAVTGAAIGSNLFDGSTDISIPTTFGNLTGFSVGTNTPVVATDTLLQGFGKLQGQVNARVLLSGATMTGTLTAQSNTYHTTAQVRNVTLSPSDLVAGSSALTNGYLYFVYE